MNCEYKKSCPDYKQDSLLCSFFYDFCRDCKAYRLDQAERIRKQQVERLSKLSGLSRLVEEMKTTD